MNSTPNADNAIELLIIEQSLNFAEAEVSTLRNASLVVHPTSVTDEQGLLDALENHDHDIVLCSADHPGISLEYAMNTCSKALPDAPFIVIYKEQAPDRLLQAMRDGARDVVSADDPDHLQIVIKREFGDLLVRRELDTVRKQLRETEQRCTTLIDHSRDAIAYVHDGMHVHANPIYLELFGYVDLGEIEGLPILDMVSKEDHKRFKKFLRSLDSDNSSADIEVKCRNSDDSTFDATLEFSPAAVDGEPCTQIIIRDQSQSKELQKKLDLLSSQDVQTGLANRPYFMQSLEQHVEEHQNEAKPCSLFYVVIDNFQQVRSRIGVVASDSLLMKIAEALANSVEEQELIARFGDHTFTILSDKGDSADAKPLAEQLRSTVEKIHFEHQDEEINVSASIGLAHLAEGMDNSQEFLNHAYQACEAARNDGGNRLSIYDAQEMTPSYGEQADSNEANVIELIRHALEKDKFRLVFQPIVSLQGDTRENYAVLVRMLDNNNEEILPNYFLKYAEESNQMAEIDRWVIKNAIEKLAYERARGRKVNFFVSLSTSALEDDGLLLWVCDCLREQKAKGAWLTFQIKDNDLRSHTQSAKKLIDGLKKIKCNLAVDQFGSNPKGETLLKHLPVDFVKLDPSLMKELSTQQDRQDNLNQLNSVAQSFDAKTIATGVEDANSLAILWTVGVNYTQGYFLQEPSATIAYDFSAP
ncbi:MAG: EAL domain-containing protein [Sedimenticola sp.]